MPSAPVAPAVGGFSAAAVPDDGMDENEREIARILQQEANEMEAPDVGAGAQSMAHGFGG